MIVLDASALITILVGSSGVNAVQLLARPLIAPNHLPIEAVAALRKLLSWGVLDEAGALAALDQVVALPIELTSPLMPRIWQLRHSLTPYDAAYVALAEARGCPLVTSDARLTGATGIHCDVQLLGD